MNYLTLYIKKERKLTTGLFISVIGLIIWLFLLQIEEKFWFGYEVGIIFSSLCTGYLISYIFNFIVVFIPKEKSVSNIAGYLTKKLNELCLSGGSYFKSLKINSKKSSFIFPPQQNELVEIFNNLDPVYSNCSTNVKTTNYNWLEYLKYVVARHANEKISEIWQILPHLDSELVDILTDFKETDLMQSAEKQIIPKDDSRVNSIENIIPQRLFGYFIQIDRLCKYLDRKFPQYTALKKDRKNKIYSV